MPSQPITIDTTTPLNVQFALAQSVSDSYGNQLLEKILLVLMDIRQNGVVELDSKAVRDSTITPIVP